MSMLRKIASLKITLAGMLALILGVLLIYIEWASASAWVALPLTVLSLNLLTALIVNPKFRRQSGLLIFHVCLLAVMLLATFGWLANLKGQIEIMEGQRFNVGDLQVVRQGALHPWHRLEALDFQQGPIQVEYAPALIRGRTESQLYIPANQSSISVGDNVPLRMDGYRFYTTSNKGYAAVLMWQGLDGKREQGAIHFPSYPMNDWNQRNEWQTPEGEKLTFELLLSEKPPAQTAWLLDRTHNNGHLRIHLNDTSVVVLHAGDSLKLKGGQLRFEEIRMWMGYDVFYDPMLAWLFAAAVVGIFGLAWHFYHKLGFATALSLRPTVSIGRSHARFSSRA